MSVFFTLVGIGVLRDSRGVGTAGGVISLAGGLTGIGVCLRRYYAFQQRVNALIAARVRRERLQEARRERRIEANRKLRSERAIESKAHLLSDRALANQRDQLRLDQALQSIATREREEAASLRAERLNSLSGDALLREVSGIFARKGKRSDQSTWIERTPISLLNQDGEREVALCLPRSEVAVEADVLALESHRVAAEANASYLVALAGFSPEAIRLAATLPVTLAEAHLLASWDRDTT